MSGGRAGPLKRRPGGGAQGRRPPTRGSFCRGCWRLGPDPGAQPPARAAAAHLLVGLSRLLSPLPVQLCVCSLVESHRYRCVTRVDLRKKVESFRARTVGPRRCGWPGNGPRLRPGSRSDRHRVPGGGVAGRGEGRPPPACVPGGGCHAGALAAPLRPPPPSSGCSAQARPGAGCPLVCPPAWSPRHWETSGFTFHPANDSHRWI